MFLSFFASVFFLEAGEVTGTIRFFSISVSLQKQQIFWLQVLLDVTEDLRF